MYKRKLHKEISSGLLALIVAFSLTGCGSSRDALEISDTESAQAEGISQETATATPATSQIIPETTTEPEPEKITYQTGLYQEKPLALQKRIVEALVVFLGKAHRIAVLRIVVRRVTVEECVFPVILADEVDAVLVLDDHLRQSA